MNNWIGNNLRSFPLLIGLVPAVICQAQSTVIEGRISDRASGEPLPFVNIAFVDSKIGTTSDIDGSFRLQSFYATDSIRVSSVGYAPVSIKIDRDREQRIEVDPIRLQTFLRPLLPVDEDEGVLN